MSIITVDKLKSLGYPISSNISQSYVDKAELDILNAYFRKLYTTLPSFDDDNNVELQCLACLTFLLLSRRNTRLMRFNAVKKKNDFSEIMEANATTDEYRRSAANYIKEVRKICSNPDAQVFDICHIYFKSIFFCD